MSKKKFSVTGIVLVASMLICLLLFLVVVPGGIGDNGNRNLDDENSPDMKTVIEDGSPLFIFDKRKSVSSLISAYDNGLVVSVDVSHGTEKDTDTVSSYDQDEISAVYRALKNITIGNEFDSDESLNPGSDMKTVVRFSLKDGGSCTFTFVNDEFYCLDNHCYSLSGADDLKTAIETLPEE